MEGLTQLYKTTCDNTDKVMKDVWKKFEEHPAASNQTYMQHLKTTIEYGTTSCFSGGLMITHAIFPFLFENTGERMIKELNEKLQHKPPQPPQPLVAKEKPQPPADELKKADVEEWSEEEDEDEDSSEDQRQ